MVLGIHGDEIPDGEAFESIRQSNIAAMGSDESLRAQALKLQSQADKYRYTYQQKWCGVPVVRLPDDIVVFQEIVTSLQPVFIVETGVARGGSLIMSASLMEMSGRMPFVLGIDIQILEHTHSAISECRWSDAITLIESDSASAVSVDALREFIFAAPDTGPGVLVLDSNHTHDHVLAELRALAPLMPVGSLVLVADTLIEEMGPEAFPDRPWGAGNNPLTALNQFLSEDTRFMRAERWSRRGLLSEFREGIIERVDVLG